MGCFNKIGFHSKLPIQCGDEIAYFICISNGRIDDITPCYFNDFIEPIYLPIFGTYNDYGSIENIEVDNSVEALEKSLGVSIEEIIETIEDNAFEPFDEEEDNLYQTILKRMLDSLPKYLRSFVEEYKELGICVTMEHKSVYDTMCKLFKHYEEPQEWDFLQIKFPKYLDDAINNMYFKKDLTIPTEKLNSEQRKLAEEINSLLYNDKNIFSAHSINGEINKFAENTIFHHFHYNMMLVNIVDLNYTLLRDTIYNFTHFNIALSNLNGRYDVATYGSQSIAEHYEEFKKLHQCYGEIIEKLNYEED